MEGGLAIQITLEQARALGIPEEYLEPPQQKAPLGVFPGPRAGRSKYNAKAMIYNGCRYHSKAEANHAMRLDLDKEAGIVRHWFRQVNIGLGPDFRTIVDFIVIYADGRVEAHEVKGFETAEFRKVRELWPKYADLPMRLIKRGRTAEIIHPRSEA